MSVHLFYFVGPSALPRRPVNSKRVNASLSVEERHGLRNADQIAELPEPRGGCL